MKLLRELVPVSVMSEEQKPVKKLVLLVMMQLLQELVQVSVVSEQKPAKKPALSVMTTE